MLDLNRTFGLTRGALTDPRSTWRSYLPEAEDRHWTALLTGPVIVLSAVIGNLVGLLGSDAVRHHYRLSEQDADDLRRFMAR